MVEHNCYFHVSQKKKKKDVPLTWNLKFDWKAALPVVDFHPIMFFSMEKKFLCLANASVEPTFSKTSRLKLQKLFKLCWPSKTES